MLPGFCVALAAQPPQNFKAHWYFQLCLCLVFIACHPINHTHLAGCPPSLSLCVWRQLTLTSTALRSSLKFEDFCLSALINFTYHENHCLLLCFGYILQLLLLLSLLLSLRVCASHCRDLFELKLQKSSSSRISNENIFAAIRKKCVHCNKSIDNYVNVSNLL